MNELEKRIKFYQEELLMDLQRLVQIASVRDVTSVKEDAPFGDGIRCAMDAFWILLSVVALQCMMLMAMRCMPILRIEMIILEYWHI